MFATLAQSDWPNALDSTAIAAFLLAAVGLPLAGYCLLAIDIAAYLRAARRALVVVHDYLHAMPAWARRHSPACLTALGLQLPCTERDVRRAYHQLAEKWHPDRGGDKERFHLLRKHFEAALNVIAEHEKEIQMTNNE